MNDEMLQPQPVSASLPTAPAPASAQVAPPATPQQSPRPTPAPTRYATDRAALERDSDVEFVIASGPGGQNRNKVQTGVRLTHRPSGVVVMATERRSQHANREAAFARLAARLEAMQRVQKPRRPTRPSAASRERRLEEKRRSSQTKRLRSAPVGE